MDYLCFSDGGYDNVNKRNGYGSFRIKTEFEDVLIRHTYPLIGSSNEAEYVTFIDLLKYLQINLPDTKNKILIISDSKLLVNQVNGLWKVSAKNISDFYKVAVTCLANVSSTNEVLVEWRPRKVLVKELGH